MGWIEMSWPKTNMRPAKCVVDKRLKLVSQRHHSSEGSRLYFLKSSSQNVSCCHLYYDFVEVLGTFKTRLFQLSFVWLLLLIDFCLQVRKILDSTLIPSYNDCKSPDRQSWWRVEDLLLWFNCKHFPPYSGSIRVKKKEKEENDDVANPDLFVQF